MASRLAYRGFSLQVDGGFDAAAARKVVDRVLETSGDRFQFVMKPQELGLADGAPKVFVKAEFLRPTDALGKRRKSRAHREGEGYAAFHAAGLPVPRLLVHGQQSRLRPRGGALVATEKIDAHNASAVLQKRLRVDVCERVCRTLGEVHARGLVHGDAAVRNFLPADGTTWIVDLPRWDRFTAAGAEDDLAHVIGSAMKAGAPRAFVAPMLAAYQVSARSKLVEFSDEWEARVLAAADSYREHLITRDGTRAARRAKKAGSVLRAKPRETGRGPAT